VTAKSVWKMTHDELVGEIATICKELGLTIQYWPDSRRAWSRGWPDLVIVGRALLFREVKTQEDGLDTEQWQWADRLARAGQDWGVWRPSHLARGNVRTELEKISDGRGLRALLPLRRRLVSPRV
jgi:hypothetical protein